MFDSSECFALHAECMPRPQLVTCVGEAHGGASYCVNMKRIVDLIRMKEARTHAAGAMVSWLRSL